MAADGIFLIDQDGALVEMAATRYTSEGVLQDLLAAHPDLLAGGLMDPSSPRRFLLVDREAGVPRSEGGPDHFSLDHLFLDQDAIPTLVEVKRSTDTRIRREVVGQMLDYASNGVRFWPPHHLRTLLGRRVGGTDAADAEVRRLTGGLDVDSFWQLAEERLRRGQVRLLFVADQIPEELQRIIEFLNEQMTTAEVLALEIRQYAGGAQRTLVPRLYGSTTIARDLKRQMARVPFEEQVTAAPAHVQDFERRLLAWVDAAGWSTRTTPSARQLFDPTGRYVVQYYPSGGVVEVSLGPLRSAGLEMDAERLADRLDELAGRRLTRKSPKVPVPAVLANWDGFFADFLSDYMAALDRAGSGRRPVADDQRHV